MFEFLKGAFKEEELIHCFASRPSLYAQVKADPQAWPLSDEKKPEGESKAEWAPGAKDGVSLLHMGQGAAGQAEARRLFELALKALSSHSQIAPFYAALKAAHAAEAAIGLTDLLAQSSKAEPERLHAMARCLASRAPDREAVKFALLMLGLHKGVEDKALLSAFAAHSEFAFYAVSAIGMTFDRHEDMLWEAAKKASGWGKVWAVRGLEKAENGVIRRWLLEEGWKIESLGEYAALAALKGGNLAAALGVNTLDEASLDPLCGLIETSCRKGGPMRAIESYEDGALALREFLRHMRGRASKMHHLAALAEVYGLLNGWDASKNHAGALQISDAAKDELLKICDQIFEKDLLRSLAQSALQSADPATQAIGQKAAKAMGLQAT